MLSLISGSVGGGNFVADSGRSDPGIRPIPPEDIPGVIDSIPDYTRLGYWGLCFFDGKLYVSTNVGLPEVEGGKPSGLYKWRDRGDVISGPWLDAANGLLWARHERLDKLIRYDGKAWDWVEQPSPGEGFTRGDILSGFRGVGTPEGFWLEGGRYAWRRFPPPYTPSEPEHWAYLAESNGRVAFAITSKPQDGGGGTRPPGQTTLWVSNGDELEAVSLRSR